MKWQKLAAVATSVLVAGSMAIGMTACNGEVRYDIEKKARTGWEDEKVYTYNTYTGQLPSIWTDVMTSDAADLDGYGYLQSSFFEYDYQFDDNGEIVPGGFTVKKSAATNLEDVTDEYADMLGLTEEEAAAGGHAFRITLRQDLKWDDGTPIDANDFVFTMQQQLSPKYLFQQASNYYSGNYVIHNAQNYVYQGQSGYFDNDTLGYTYADLSLEGGVYKLGGQNCYIALNQPLGWLLGDTLENTVQANADMLDKAAFESLKALDTDGNGQVEPTQDAIDLLEDVITFSPAWNETVENVVNYMYAFYTYPTVDWKDVGYQAHSDYELDLIIDNTIHPIDANGNLTYDAAYTLSNMPLVKEDVWKANEVAPSVEGGLYTNNYAQGDVSRIPSWGPYKLTSYQTDVAYTLERNTNWYGYGLDQYATMFQTDKISVRYIPEWNTAWQAFRLGQLDGVSLDATVMSDYRNTQRAYFTPDTTTFSLNLQSSNLLTDTRSGNNMFAYPEFRQALSLALDRNDFCVVNSPSSQPALGYLNDMYYYDVENGGIYRDTTQAREALLEAYGAEKNADGNWVVGGVEYDDVVEAELSLTGYNLELARDLMEVAYTAAKEAGHYTDGENIELTYGITEQTASTERVRSWLESAFNAATEGTPLEGKIKITYFTMDASNWSTQFMNGEFDICFGGWGNAPFDPFYLFGATQIWDANRWAVGWNPGSVTLTLDVAGGDGQESYEDLSMNLYQWDAALQGLSSAGDSDATPATYNFSAYPIDTKLEILAAEEAAVLKTYWGIPVYSRYSASLMGYKVEYISYEYNTFMTYGGVQYMSYNFDDTEWAEFCAKNGELNYKY